MTPTATLEGEPVVAVRMSMDDARKLLALINKVAGADLSMLYDVLANVAGPSPYDVQKYQGMSSHMAFIKVVRADNS